MKSKMLNLCVPVRVSLEAMGVSTVNVVNAINAQRGECALTDETAKAGNPKGNHKKGTYSISEGVTYKYAGELNIPRSFDVWHSLIEKANAFSQFGTVEIPGTYVEWLGKFKADKGAVKPAPEAKAQEPVKA